tara:strand:- start:78 stop:785 length:708 start_codon:yes stop_codon:yes gene_type:complete
MTNNILNIINLIKKKNYNFCKFNKINKKNKIIYLRFDVDISPYNAKKIGELLNKKKISANFFFQINAETYNCFSLEIIQIIKNLRKQNHCVGLHIDQNLIRLNQIDETIKWFSRNICTIDKVVSFHRPSKLVIKKKFKKFRNTYEKIFFNSYTYVSDSRNNKEFITKLIGLLQKEEKQIQLLLHPEWWTKFKKEKIIFDEILKRRNDELREYLGHNFKKVFSKYNKNKINYKRVI